MNNVACPSCQRRLALPDHGWNGWAQCPACSAVFQLDESKDRQALGDAHPRRDNAARSNHHVQARKFESAGADEEEFSFHKKLFREGFVTGVAWLAIIGFMGVAARESIGGGVNSIVGAVLVAPMAGLLVAVLFLYLFGNFPARRQEMAIRRIARFKRITGLLFVLEFLIASCSLYDSDSDYWFGASLFVCGALCCVCLYEAIRVFPMLLTVVVESVAEEQTHADSESDTDEDLETGITTRIENLSSESDIRQLG